MSLVPDAELVALRASLLEADEFQRMAESELTALRLRLQEAERALRATRKERDEVYAVNAANNYDIATRALDAIAEIVVLCEPDRIPLPLLNSKILRVARAVLGGDARIGEPAARSPETGAQAAAGRTARKAGNGAGFHPATRPTSDLDAFWVEDDTSPYDLVAEHAQQRGRTLDGDAPEASHPATMYEVIWEWLRENNPAALELCPYKVGGDVQEQAANDG